MTSSARAIRGGIAVLGILVCALGCLDLAHTNPFDPAAKVEVQVTGPDSAYSLQQIITFSFTSTPEWPGVIDWKTANESLLHSLGDGRFGVVGVAAPPNDTASVVVFLGTHSAAHRVVVSQRVAGFTFVCVYRGEPCVFPVGVRDANVNVEGHDANGFAMRMPYSVQVESSRPSVVRIDGSRPATPGRFTFAVTALAPGTSYFIASSGSVKDSVLVIVQ
jgi:hypothetical protein